MNLDLLSAFSAGSANDPSNKQLWLKGASLILGQFEQLIKKTGVYAKKVSSDAGMDFYDHTGAIFYVGQNAKVLGIYTPPIVNDLINKDIVRALK